MQRIGSHRRGPRGAHPGVPETLGRRRGGPLRALGRASAASSGPSARDGFVVEHGAEGFVARSEAVPALAAALGIGADLSASPRPARTASTAPASSPSRPARPPPSSASRSPATSWARASAPSAAAWASSRDALAEAVARTATRGPARGPRDDQSCARGSRLAHRRRRRSGTRGGRRRRRRHHRRDRGPHPGGRLRRRRRARSRRAPTLSSCTVTLAYPREAHRPPARRDRLRGGGRRTRSTASGRCTFITSKFPDRAPEGQVSLRIFFRPADPDLAVDERRGVGRPREPSASGASFRCTARRIHGGCRGGGPRCRCSSPGTWPGCAPWKTCCEGRGWRWWGPRSMGRGSTRRCGRRRARGERLGFGAGGPG